MKRTYSFLLTATLAASMFLSSCNKTTTENTETTTDTATVLTTDKPAETVEVAKAEFICSMDCEKGKIYDAAGKCPTCKMDLIDKKTKDAAKPADQGHGHNHGEGGHKH